jgi:Peptidase family S49
MLAMHPGAIQSGPMGFFWMLGSGTKANDRHGSVSTVHIRDGLEHHDDSWSDNYESIVARVGDALSGADVARAHKAKQREHEWREGYKKGYQPLADIEIVGPSTLLMCIDSPGGVVSGLNEAVATLQKMSKESGVKFVAYANEMAASAAYALACACSEIVCPASAIIGSIGVISTMVSVAEADKEDGIDVRLITSGDRKADGHPHAPISDEAVSTERDRVMKLADAFWGLAGKARGISKERLQGYQAGIFLGHDARRRGLVDRVGSLADTIAHYGTPRDPESERSDAKVKKSRLTALGLVCHGMAHIPQRRR